MACDAIDGGDERRVAADKPFKSAIRGANVSRRPKRGASCEAGHWHRCRPSLCCMWWCGREEAHVGVEYAACREE